MTSPHGLCSTPQSLEPEVTTFRHQIKTRIRPENISVTMAKQSQWHKDQVVSHYMVYN